MRNAYPDHAFTTEHPRGPEMFATPEPSTGHLLGLICVIAIMVYLAVRIFRH